MDKTKRACIAIDSSAGTSHKYDDLIGLPHPVSKFHPPMTRIKRAAQFAPFDALTGFGAAIKEAERETEEKKELSEDEIYMINARLAVIQQHIKEQPNIAITYFIPDNKKAGGRYVTVSGNVKMLDGIEHAIIVAIPTAQGMEYNVEYGELTDERKQKIHNAIEDAVSYGYDLISIKHRYFFVDQFYETDFKKCTLYPPRGTRIFDLSSILEMSELPSTEEIAELLKKKTWE